LIFKKRNTGTFPSMKMFSVVMLCLDGGYIQSSKLIELNTENLCILLYVNLKLNKKGRCILQEGGNMKICLQIKISAHMRKTSTKKDSQ
jgi:hypothetical protein